MGEGAKTVVLSFKTKCPKWEGSIDLEPVLLGNCGVAKWVNILLDTILKRIMAIINSVQ
jgi:hypothetical protein